MRVPIQPDELWRLLAAIDDQDDAVRAVGRRSAAGAPAASAETATPATRAALTAGRAFTFLLLFTGLFGRGSRLLGSSLALPRRGRRSRRSRLIATPTTSTAARAATALTAGRC